MVRWEVSYEGKSVQKKFEILPDLKFRKMSQIGQGGPRAIQKVKKKLGPKGPWAQIWAHGPYSPWALFPLVGSGGSGRRPEDNIADAKAVHRELHHYWPFGTE